MHFAFQAFHICSSGVCNFSNPRNQISSGQPEKVLIVGFFFLSVQILSFFLLPLMLSFLRSFWHGYFLPQIVCFFSSSIFVPVQQSFDPNSTINQILRMIHMDFYIVHLPLLLFHISILEHFESLHPDLTDVPCELAIFDFLLLFKEYVQNIFHFFFHI